MVRQRHPSNEQMEKKKFTTKISEFYVNKKCNAMSNNKFFDNVQ